MDHKAAQNTGEACPAENAGEPANAFSAELKKQGASEQVVECFEAHADKNLGGFTIASELRNIHQSSDMQSSEAGNETSAQRVWLSIGMYFMQPQRLPEAARIFESLYHQMLEYQKRENRWIHKGAPLAFLSDCNRMQGFALHAKKCYMYMLCEDAVAYQGIKRVDGSGVYARASLYGMSDTLVDRYTERVFKEIWKPGEPDMWFPEELLLRLGDEWMSEYPSVSEYGRYHANPQYVRHLRERTGEDGGAHLERLAHYLVSMIPGARAYRRRRLGSGSDYDVVGSFEGPGLDFRTELGRYFACECKDWAKPADVTVIAKMAYFLQAANMRFGILFSSKGITGVSDQKAAAREQLRVYSGMGIAIVVIDRRDLELMEAGESFLSLIRTRYEKVRLDVTEPQTS